MLQAIQTAPLPTSSPYERTDTRANSSSSDGDGDSGSGKGGDPMAVVTRMRSDVADVESPGKLASITETEALLLHTVRTCAVMGGLALVLMRR